LAISALVVAACAPAGSPSPAPASPAPSPAPASPSPEPSPSTAAVVFPLEIKDANGNTHRFEKAVTKFGSLWDGAQETLADLGIRLVGEAYGHDASSPFWYPQGAPEQTLLEYDVEKWAASGAEVILTAAPGFAGYDDVVEDALKNVVYLHFPPRDTGAPNGAAAWKWNLELVASLAGVPEAAETAIARYDKVIAELDARAPGDAASREVLLQIFTEDGTYMILPSGMPFCDTLEEHGWGRCAVPEELRGQTESNVLEVSAEAILELDPEWIAYIVFDPSQSFSSRTDPTWSQLSAVKAGHVYDTPAPYNCCSLRHLEWALQDFAHHVWGDAAGVPDPGPLADFDPAKSGLLAGG
jgi:ABC-type Fe3+-hydroxamate transport system substrate-binding protein